MIRVSVVEALLSSAAGELDGPAKHEIYAESSHEERQAAARILVDAARRDRDLTALNLTNQQLAALAAVWAVVSRWDCSLDRARKLGATMKVLPGEDVALVERALVWGGFATVDHDGD